MKKIIAWGAALLLASLAFLLCIAWAFMLGWNTAVVEAVSVARPISYQSALILVVMLACISNSASGTKKS
jgi:hypothetical protein